MRDMTGRDLGRGTNQLHSIEEGASLYAASSGPVGVIRLANWGSAPQAEGEECQRHQARWNLGSGTAGSSFEHSMVGKA